MADLSRILQGIRETVSTPESVDEQLKHLRALGAGFDSNPIGSQRVVAGALFGIMLASGPRSVREILNEAERCRIGANAFAQMASECGLVLAFPDGKEEYPDAESCTAGHGAGI